ncbi:MAG: DUF4126 domain-containing protein [Chthoniobacterales bacterium]
MGTLELLGTALGLATLAGLNLYLTVFVTGLAVRMDWIHLANKYEQLEILADPAVLWVAGTLFVLEFFADKVPWVDSLWDSVHTIIRPVGGAMVAITVLGDVHPAYDVIVGLLGGGMALTSHAAKAGTRLLANASPEPFSNIGLSLGEDAVVLGGLGLIAFQPVVALALAVAAFVLACWLVPKIVSRARVTLWFAWKWIAYLLGSRSAGPADANDLPTELALEMRRVTGEDWAGGLAIPAVAGKGTEFPKHAFGWLLSSCDDNGTVYFARSGRPRPVVMPLEVSGSSCELRRGMISDRLSVRRADGGIAQTLHFDRSRREQAEALAVKLRGAGDAEPAPQLIEA